jgi:hypothetical protein
MDVWIWCERIAGLGGALTFLFGAWRALKHLNSIAQSGKILIQHAPSIETVAKLAPLCETILRNFEPMVVRLAEQGAILAHMQIIIDDHSKVLTQQSDVLESQSKTLESQNKDLEEIKKDVRDGFDCLAKAKLIDPPKGRD